MSKNSTKVLRSTVLSLLVCSLLLSSRLAWSIDNKVSGFLSFGAGKLDTDDATISDYEDKWSYEVDSVFALQFESQLRDDLSATLQMVARGHTLDKYDNWTPQVEWAYLNYKLNPTWRLRAGRLRIPYFRLSDYLEVGYAYEWVRPPLDAYPFLFANFTNHDGVELFHVGRYFEKDVTLQLFYGAFEKDTVSDGLELNIDVNQTTGLNITVGNELYTIRYSYISSVSTFNVKELDFLTQSFSSFANVDPIFSRIGNMFQINNEPVNYNAIGFVIDYNKWLLQSDMFITRETHYFISDFKGGYLSLSYQFDVLTPYITVGAYADKQPQQILTAITKSEALVPVGVNPVLDVVRSFGRSAILPSHYQNTQAIGLRYDIADSMDVKFEILQMNPIKNTWGNLDVDLASAPEPHSVRFYTVTFDMIF